MFRGRNYSIDPEHLDKGMDGVNALNSIPNGYVMECENVDLGQPGRIQKRTGYHLFGQRLPVRTRQIEGAGTTKRIVLDAIPILSYSVSLYANTALNATATSDALYFRSDDSSNTIFATFTSNETFTKDSLLRAIGSDGLEHFVQPIEVFQSTGTVKILLPYYVKNWWTGVSLSDTIPSVQTFHSTHGLSLARVTEREIVGLSVIQTVPFRVRISFSSTSEAANIELGATVFFETCVRKLGGDPVCGTVIAVSTEYVDAECEPAETVVGVVDQSYFQLRYINAKHLRYKSATHQFDMIGKAHTTSTAVWNTLIKDAASFSLTTSTLTGSYPSATTQEIGFIYGLKTQAGPVNILSKYFDVESGKDRVLCGIDGYIFAEGDHPSTGIPTIASLIYTGTSIKITANITDETFAIPLAGASSVYEIGDNITVQYADGTYSDTTSEEGIITNNFTVEMVDATTLYVSSGGERSYFLRKGAKWVLTRTSSRVYIKDATSHLPIQDGLTVQYAVANTLLPVFEVKNVDYTEASQYLDLDTEIEWSSDSYLIPQSIFTPVPSDISCTYSSSPGERIDVNCVSIERSSLMACGLSGIWRYNGVQLLNMRIPRTGSGWIRSVPGTGGTLHLDTQADGTKTGRRYAFVVEYSYSELVNGKLVEHLSGMSAVGNYSLLSEQDDLGSSYSRVVELQVPCLPRGIGLPADDIKINVYRTKSGTQLTEPSAEVYLLERQVNNEPDASFVTIIAGTEPDFAFTEANYKPLAASIIGSTPAAEHQREVVDPPLCTVISTLKSRVLAASGYDHPYVSFICKDVFSTVNNTFKAHYDILHKPRQISETAHRFISCPCDITTTSGTGGAKDATFGGTGVPFQVLSMDAYDIKTITYVDDSHLFKITAASITADKQYLLRLANGVKEALSPGTSDPYYNGYGFESQVFTGTSTSTQVSSQKKWTRSDATKTVVPPTETVLVFEKIADINAISTTNGLIIIGNTAKDASGAVEFLLYTSASITTNDYIILKGLGTTGQIRDVAGKQLSFDKDLIMKVMNGSSPFTLKPLVKGISYASHFAEPAIRTAVSVSNASSGVIEEPFSIYKLQSTSARSTTNWSVSPQTAAIKLTTSPSIAPVAGDRICIDGLPSQVPPNSGFSYSGSFEITSFVGDTFHIKVTPPETARGTLTQDFSTATKKGKLVWAKGSIIEGTNRIQIRLKSAVLSVAIAAGDWVYLVTKGESSDAYCLALTGWFKVSRVSLNFSSWVTSLSAPAEIVGMEIEYFQTLDYASITGASYTRVLCASRTGNGTTTQLTLNVPVPALATKDGSLDISGILYSTIDGYTPYERVAKPLSHAINCVLREVGFSYWGGRVIGNVEDAHPGNIIPTNGLKFMPHLHPDNVYRYRYYQGAITSTEFEPQWICTMQPACWRVEADTQQDFTGTAYSTVAFLTAKEYRPSRLWFTNPTGTLQGQAFRESSFDDIDSQDGERITGMVPFQTYSILAKKNSLWRLSFGSSTELSKDKVPGSIGSSSHKNMVSTDRGVFLLHDTGIYISDGTVCETIHQVKRVFDDRTIQNRPLFPLTSGYHDPLSKIVTIGAPLSASNLELTDKIDGQFSFNYSLKSITLDSVTSGWSVNTQIPATAWIGIYNSVYFSDSYGSVFRLRSEKGASKFSDERKAIPLMIKTRHVFADDNINARFMRGLYFQFGKDTSVNMDISMSWDFFQSYQHLITYTLPVDGFGTGPFGSMYFGSDKVMENRRKTPDQLRVSQFSLKFVDNTLDSCGTIYGMYVQSNETDTKIIGQGDTRS